MKLCHTGILALMALAVAICDASSLPNMYWTSVLPGVSMPNAVKELLSPDVDEQKRYGVRKDNPKISDGARATYSRGATNVGIGNVGVGNGGVGVGSTYPGGATNVGVGSGGVGVRVKTPSGGTSVGVGSGGVGVGSTYSGGATNVGVGKGGVGVGSTYPRGATNVGVGNGGVGVRVKSPSGGTSVGVGSGGVGVGSTYPGGATNVGVGKGGVGVGSTYPGGATNVGVGSGGVGVRVKSPSGGTAVGVGKGGVSVSTGNHRKPGSVNVRAGPFFYRYAATDTQLHDNPDVTLFFQEKDMIPGKNFNLHFTKGTDTATFIPRRVADSIPFSSNKLPEIYTMLSVEPGSPEAENVETTLKECEQIGIPGEEKTCATSLESMIDFSVSKLGKKVHAYSTELENERGKQKYVVMGKVKTIGSGRYVACHKEIYPYAVFYCHTSETTRAYVVSLNGAEGTKANALAVCHSNTASWNPKHIAFKVLDVKPGTAPICHFLPEDHILWTKG